MKKLTSGKLISYTFLVLLLAIVLYPLAWLLISSFKYEKDLLNYPPQFFADSYTLNSFKKIFTVIPMGTYLKNTVLYAGITTFLSVMLDSAAGYAFARMNFRWKNQIFILILITMMVPFQVIMIPLFLETYFMGILNTYPGLIIPKIASAFGIFMMRAYFFSLPKELEEAGRIDGLNEFQIYWKIMLPLCKPGLLTLAIFHLMNNWNDLLYPLMMTNSVEMRTLSAGLALLVGEHATSYGPALAGAAISIVPLLIMYIFMQKYFVGSVAMSGSKE